MRLTKDEYIDIIRTYRSKKTDALLHFFTKYPPNIVKNCLIKQIIKTTNDFNLAVELSDAKNEVNLKCVFMKLEGKKFKNVDEEALVKKYEASDLKNDIIKDELYLKFKPLFKSKVKLYRSYYFHFVFNLELPLKHNIVNYKKQDFDEIAFVLSIYNDISYLTRLFLLDKANSNLYFTRNKIIIKSDKLLDKRKVLDTQIEAIIFQKILSIDIEKLNEIYNEILNDDTLDIARGEMIYRYNILSKIISKIKS